SLFFFFNATASTEIYTLSLHDALPISSSAVASASLPLAAWRLFLCLLNTEQPGVNSKMARIVSALAALRAWSGRWRRGSRGTVRSEERRVGKEWRYGWARYE